MSNNTAPFAKHWVLASHNAGKLAEFHALFAETDINIQSARDFNLPDVEETGLTFVENALIKARHVSRLTGLPALADDSGLSVDYLKGQPGIYSARFSKEQTDSANNAKLLELMASAPADQRQASFHCVLVLLRHENDPTPIIAHGQWQGKLLQAPKGDHGFGYDPLFWIESEQASSAELSPQRKNTLSHRAKALQHLFQLITPHD